MVFCPKCSIIVTLNTSNREVCHGHLCYKLWSNGQSIRPIYIIQVRESAGNIWKCGIKDRGVRRPRAPCPTMLSLVYTSVADCRRQSPTVLSLEQATTGVIASCRSNALELSESINDKQSPDRTTKWSIHGIQIQMQIRIRIQISSLSCIYTEK